MQKTIKNLSIAIAFSFLGATSHIAFCEENTAKKIEDINNEMSVLTKRQELLDARIKYAESMKKVSKPGLGDADSEPPRVKGIEGFEGKFIATCVSQSGRIVTRGLGDEVPGGWKIAEINSKSVVFVHGKTSARVQASSGGDSVAPISQTPSMPGFPSGFNR